MLKFVIKKETTVNRDNIFSLSTNIEQFSKLMPKYFKSLKISEKINSDIYVEEEILFLKKTFKVKTKHIIKKPNIHEIHILSGFLKNSRFLENYENLDGRTQVIIKVNLEFNGILKLLNLFRSLIGNRINKTMDDFINNCESHEAKLTNL